MTAGDSATAVRGERPGRASRPAEPREINPPVEESDPFAFQERFLRMPETALPRERDRPPRVDHPLPGNLHTRWYIVKSIPDKTRLTFQAAQGCNIAVARHASLRDLSHGLPDHVITADPRSGTRHPLQTESLLATRPPRRQTSPVPFRMPSPRRHGGCSHWHPS